MDDINRYFEVLGLKPGASLEEVKEAYRDLVKVWHPDRFEHDPKIQNKAQEKLKEINQAYQRVQAFLNDLHNYQQASGTSNTATDETKESAKTETKQSAETNKRAEQGYSPPPQPPKQERSAYRKDYQAPRPWVRFWARTLDLNIFLFLGSFFIGFLYGYFYALINHEAPPLPGIILISILLGLPVAFVIDAISMTLFGNTPGKAIFRISVANADGSKLSFRDALLRNMRVYFSGYGLGIPLLQLVTFSFAYNKLTKNGKTSWDDNLGLSVSHEHIGGFRIAAYVCLFLITTSIAGRANREYLSMLLQAPAPAPTAEQETLATFDPFEGTRKKQETLATFDPFQTPAPAPAQSAQARGNAPEREDARFIFYPLVVVDKVSGLMWARDANLANRNVNWGQAKDFIITLNENRYAGFPDWRLPEETEFETLVIYAKGLGYGYDGSDAKRNRTIASALNEAGFVNVIPEFYWTAKRSNTYPGAVAVGMWNGNIGANDYGSMWHVFPVRNAR